MKDPAHEDMKATARARAAQAWCTDKTKDIEMDSRLAEAFANILVSEWEDKLLNEAEKQAEQLQVQLAGCGAAALGATDTKKSQVAQQGDYGWSPAYQDVLALRRNYDRERKRNSDLVGAGQKPVDRQELLGRVSTAASRALYYTIGKTAIPFVNVDQAMAELTPALQEALVGLIIPYEEENPRPFEELLPQYVAWRMGVDEDRCLDEFDMALGWFAGKGFSHDEACKAAAHARDYDWGKEDEEG